MKLVINILFIWLTLGVTLFAQESKNYIYYDANSQETVRIDVEGEGEKEIPKFRKETTPNILYFYIGNKEFTFMKQNHKPEKISVEKVKQIKFKDISEVTQEWAMENNNPPIYLIEKKSESEYCQYRVGFIHNFIMIE